MTARALALPGVVSAPHTHDRSTVTSIMMNVVLGVLPCTLAGLWLFGWAAFNLLMVTVLATLAFEAFALTLSGQPVRRRLGDGSALVAGWLLALTLPPWAPWWIGVTGAAIAMLLAKHPFGGIGQNLFNPAIVARVALLIAFPVEMTQWPSPLTVAGPRVDFFEGLKVTFGQGIPDGLTGPTVLSLVRVNGNPVDVSWLHSMFGERSGSLGETSVACIALGALWLLSKRVISWHIPVGILAGALLPAIGYHLVTNAPLDGATHLVSGGLLFTSIFIATDPASSPAADVGKFVYGVGLGLIVFVIRSFASLPEGVGFAVLLMNSLSPILDRKFKPRVYGRSRSGVPLTPLSPGEAKT
jgi:Na+-translocating ferredoxin:NAD+ oxidoreductase subunit D